MDKVIEWKVGELSAAFEEINAIQDKIDANNLRDISHVGFRQASNRWVCGLKAAAVASPMVAMGYAAVGVAKALLVGTVGASVGFLPLIGATAVLCANASKSISVTISIYYFKRVLLLPILTHRKPTTP